MSSSSSSTVEWQYTNILIVTMQSKSGFGRTKTEQNSSSMWEKSSGSVLNQKSGTIRSPTRQTLAMKLLQSDGLHIPFLLVHLSCMPVALLTTSRARCKWVELDLLPGGRCVVCYTQTVSIMALSAYTISLVRSDTHNASEVQCIQCTCNIDKCGNSRM